MPLSKERDAARKRQSRLDARLTRETVQPKYIIYEGKQVLVPELDADGNVIYDMA